MIFDIIIYILVLVAVVIFHEIGHIYYMKKELNQNVKIWFSKGFILVGKQEQYIGHTPKQYAGIYGYGILFGLVPFGVVMLFNIMTPFYLVGAVIAYLAGCYLDIKNLWRFGIKKKEWVI